VFPAEKSRSSAVTGRKEDRLGVMWFNAIVTIAKEGRRPSHMPRGKTVWWAGNTQRERSKAWTVDLGNEARQSDEKNNLKSRIRYRSPWSMLVIEAKSTRDCKGREPLRLLRSLRKPWIIPLHTSSLVLLLIVLFNLLERSPRCYEIC
jgi:hypothetical protein